MQDFNLPRCIVIQNVRVRLFTTDTPLSTLLSHRNQSEFTVELALLFHFVFLGSSAGVQAWDYRCKKWCIRRKCLHGILPKYHYVSKRQHQCCKSQTLLHLIISH